MLRACDQRLGSQRAIAALFGVSQAFVEKLLRRRRMTGAIAPRPHAGGRRAICHAAALAHVRHPVQEQPEATLAEFCEPWWAQRGLRVSVPTMARLVTHLRRPRTKSRSPPVRARPLGSNRRGWTLRNGWPRSTRDS